jgi:hypothetical protein
LRLSIIPIVILSLLTAGPAAAQMPKENPECAHCGDKVSGAYFETQGDFYHADCFLCSQCGSSITGDYVTQKQKNYHKKCFDRHVALKCEVCGGVIRGQYLLNFWGNAYHQEHLGQILQCDFCSRFIVGTLVKGTVRLPDGRHLCGECRPSAVTSADEAGQLMLEVVGQLENYGLEVDPGRIELFLVGRDSLSQIASGRSDDTKGFTDYNVKKNLFGQIREETIQVYLLFGMPEVQMRGTIAHELCHVWQFREGRLDQDQVLSEGSANFASYLVLRQAGRPEAEFIIDNMMHDDDPAYGEGFRKVRDYAEKKGLDKWRRLLKKKHKRPPL